MATSKVLKPRRGSTAEHASFRGVAYEITFDTTKKTIVAHDGLTMGGFPLAHEAQVSEVDTSLRTLIEEKVAGIEGVSPSDLAAIEVSLRGLINNVQQQQTAKNDNQDILISELSAKNNQQDAAISAAQTTANSALEEAQNITVPVTSVNGKTGAVEVGTVRSINGEDADAAGNVTITLPTATVSEKHKSTFTPPKWNSGSVTTKSITGLIINKPLFVAVKANEAFPSSTNMIMGVASGATITHSHNAYGIEGIYLFGKVPAAKGDTFYGTLIPTATSVSLEFISAYNQGTGSITLEVYQ